MNKLNFNQEGYQIADEAHAVASLIKFEHDNVVQGSVQIYTQPNKEGTRFYDFTVAPDTKKPWESNIHIEDLSLLTGINTVYVHYTTLGDEVDADDLNLLFTFVSEGKNKIATALTDKGTQASGEESFDSLTSKIKELNVLTGNPFEDPKVAPADLSVTLTHGGFTEYDIQADTSNIAIFIRKV